MIITCPHCHAGYTADECGIAETPGLLATIACRECRTPFELIVEEVPVTTTVPHPAWWGRLLGKSTTTTVIERRTRTHRREPE